MKNMKKKELKSFKKPEQSNKKQLSLQQTQPLSNRFDQNALLKTLLSPSTKRLMQGFSTGQKKIITDQFQKMMKKLKKKLGSGPVQQEQDGSTSRLECKTQRMDFVDHSNISKETIRKDVSTERKFISAKLPKHNTKLTFNHNLEKSPKKSTRNNSSQLQIQRRSSTVTSPTKKNNSSQGMHSHRSTKPSNFKPKRKRTLQSDKNTPFFIRQNDGKKNKQEHYILFGDSFVEVDNDVMKIIEDQEQEDEVKINNESCLDYDFKKCKQQKQRDEQCFNWKYFAEHKQEKKNAKIKSKEKFPDEAIIEQWYHKQNERVLTNGLQFAEKIKSVNSVNSLSDNSSIVQRIVGVTTPKQPTHAQNLFKQFYTNTTPTHPTSNSNNSNCNNKSNNNNKNSTNIDSLQPPILHCLQLSRSQSEEQIEDSSPNKISQQLQQSSHYHGSYLDSLSQRQSVITLQLKTNQEILSCLLVQGKIQKKVYQKYMDMAIQLYDREMTETNRVREILEQNENKIGQIMKWNEQGIQIREKIQTVGVQEILNKMFQGYQKIVNKQEQPQIGLAIDIDSLKKHENPEFSKSHQYQTHIQRTLNEPQNHQPIHPQPSQTKQQIQQRTAFQLGVRSDPTPTSTPPQKSGFSTSVLAIYQFLKNFFSFLKNYHLRQFLAYINMPYGYSVQQRLRFMQGYDDDDELYGQQNGGGIVYGLEEVLRPAIFQEFYRNFGSKGFGQSKANTDFQKLHYRMVFDALNQGFNQFRPYFLINGCPYLWTTTEKALTYYFIRQDCYQQLLQKVQIQILKWSSSLCGLLLQPSQPKQANLSSPKTLQQIFETYTINTPTELLEHRQQRILKQQKLQTEQTNFQWYFHDEFKTALLYEISSCILEDLAHECAIFATTGMEYEQVIALLGDTELNLNFK